MSSRRSKKNIRGTRKVPHPGHPLRSNLPVFSLQGHPAALCKDELHWKAVFDSSQDGVLVADVTRKRFLSCNKAISRMLGFSEEELLQLSVGDIHPPWELKRVLAAFRQLVRGQVSVVSDIPMRCKDGNVFYADISGCCVKFSGRQCLVGFFRDMTRRKETEKALLESEEMFKTLTERSPNMIFINQGGKVVYANPKCEEVMGYTREEFYSPKFDFLKLMHPDDINMVRRNFRTHQKGREVVPYEYKMVTREGKLIHGLLTSKLIRYRGVPAILGIITDITERKQAEEAVQKALSLERATLESTADGILVVDGATGKITDFNLRFIKLWNIPGRLLRDRDDRRLLRHVVSQLKDPRRFLSKVTELYKHPRKKSFDVLEFKDGRVFERYSHPQLLGGKPVGRVWSFRDVTRHKHVEADLVASEQRYRSIFESSHDAMMTLEPPSWRFVTANASMARMFRAKHLTELLPTSPWSLSPKFQPDGRASSEKAKDMIRTALRHGVYFFEWAHRRLDGSVFPAEVLLTRMVKDGRTSLLATVRDITERKQAEEAVLKTSQFNESIINSLPGIFYVFDSKGKPWHVNKKFLEITGYSLKQVLRMHPLDFFSGEDRIKVKSRIREVFEKGESFIEADFLNKGGKKTPYYFSGIRTTINGESLVVGVGIDITARKQAEDFLSEHRHQLLQVIDTVPHMIFAEDGQGRFLLVNRAVARAYGKEPRELIGLRRQDVHKVCEESDSYLKVDQEILRIGRSKVIPGECFTDHQGRRHILQTIKIPFRMVGAKDKCILGVSVDVTGQKKIEEFRNEIVRTVSHELRTPLSIQKEGISLLKDEMAGPVNEEQQKILDAVMRSIDRLARMITGLLDISSIESGQIKLVKKNVDLAGLVRDVVSDFKGRAGEREILMEIQLPERPIRVFADPDKLAQVLSNMVDNALKFTPRKGTVRISLTLLEDHVECEVRDSGIGIAPENIEKLFEKFQQFARTVGPGERGFGLGLSIAKGIIDLHGGRMFAESKVGKGTRIIFSLPLCSKKEE